MRSITSSTDSLHGDEARYYPSRVSVDDERGEAFDEVARMEFEDDRRRERDQEAKDGARDTQILAYIEANKDEPAVEWIPGFIDEFHLSASDVQEYLKRWVSDSGKTVTELNMLILEIRDAANMIENGEGDRNEILQELGMGIIDHADLVIRALRAYRRGL